MKTKLIPWWENPVRFLLTFLVWTTVVLLMVLVMTAFLYDWEAVSVTEGYQVTFWTYETDSIFGTVPHWLTMFLAMEIVAVPLISLLTWSAFVKRRLFRYEINKGWVPYVNGAPVAFPRREELELIEWREPHTFTGMIYAGKHNGQHWVWASDVEDGEYMVDTRTFIDRLDELNDDSGLYGVWTWKWKRYDFVELVLIKSISHEDSQLEFNFGA